MERQTGRCLQYAAAQGYEVVLTVKEVASGLNERRRRLQRLLGTISRREIDVLVIEFPDRLARFGYTYLTGFCEAFHVRVDVVAGTRERSPQEELVEDMLTIITSFSARLYGKRGAALKKSLREVITACSTPSVAS